MTFDPVLIIKLDFVSTIAFANLGKFTPPWHLIPFLDLQKSMFDKILTDLYMED